MSMVINLIEDHNIYLCEGGPVYNGGVQPTPITYLTQWKIVGNSQVHTDPFLTSWKVSGNSIVQDGVIMSCGDYSDVDGKYHVKISNGVIIFDIPLDAPLRKVNDVSDTIEFPSETEGKALVTRPFKQVGMASFEWRQGTTGVQDSYRYLAAVSDAYPYEANEVVLTMNTGGYINNQGNNTWTHVGNKRSIGMYPTMTGYPVPNFAIYDPNYDKGEDLSAFLTYLADKSIIYRLATPTTELIDVSPFAVSPTDTYTSANVVPFSAFEHTENKEIWSCGEYNATDGKYHILVQPQGGSIADIALNEPLRKVNDVADTIEFPSDTEGKALVTRNLAYDKLGNFTWNASDTSRSSSLKRWSTNSLQNVIIESSDILTIEYEKGNTWNRVDKTYSYDLSNFFIYDEDYNTADSYNDFIAHINNYDIIYELATPTTELVDAPQIEEAESYSMVISQGGKAVEWSDFVTE